MSTRTATQSSLLQESQIPKQDASQSALHYLFQEVSRLASPPHSSPGDTHALWAGSEGARDGPLTPPVKSVQSPLKVLSLINRQCERLQHPSEDDDEAGFNSQMLVSVFGFSKPTEGFLDAAQPLVNESNSVRRSRKDSSSEVCESRKSGLTLPVRAEAQTPEVKLSVALCDWTKECLSTQHTFYDFLPEAGPARALCPDDHLTFSANEKCAAQTILPLDHNANICLNVDQPSGPLEAVHTYSTLDQQHDQVKPASTCEDFSEETPTPRPGEASERDSALTPVDKDSSSLWRSKRRKQPRPSRSPSVQDPDFQGVTFRMDTELDDTKEQCRLLITSKYSTDLSLKSLKRTRLRTRVSQKSLKTSSDEDSDSTSEAKDKVCASCCTKKTPMWRDAEDGTPLCNACGIRYKKYRVRCINCWNIPKKDGNSVSRCGKCGHFVKQTSAQRRPTV